MATAYVNEIPGVTLEQGAALVREMGLTSPPDGQVLHIEGPMDGGGMRIVDV